MLPTTPLHVELFREAEIDALVMTSGNRSDEHCTIGTARTPQKRDCNWRHRAKDKGGRRYRAVYRTICVAG